MRILIDICHPAQAHFFRNPINIMLQRGHKVLIVARNKDVTIDLLKSWNYNHFMSAKTRKGFGALREVITRNAQIYSLSLKFKPDILMAHNAGSSIVPAAKLIRKPSLIFVDTEKTGPQIFFKLLATQACTPKYYQEKLGKNHIRYDGFKELSSLHPAYFTPNEKILKENSLTINDKFFILRFVSWSAHHDIRQQGVTYRNKLRLIKYLEKFGRVLISSEEKIPKKLSKYNIQSKPEDFHDLLYYSHLVFSDGGTVVTEAALLGTPAIRCNSFVGTKHSLGIFSELEYRYSLVFSLREFSDAFQKVKELVYNNNLKKEWGKKRERLLKEKIDVAKFVVDQAEYLATKDSI